MYPEVSTKINEMVKGLYQSISDFSPLAEIAPIFYYLLQMLFYYKY